jgi:hypothetical protein
VDIKLEQYGGNFGLNPMPGGRAPGPANYRMRKALCGME